MYSAHQPGDGRPTNDHSTSASTVLTALLFKGGALQMLGVTRWVMAPSTQIPGEPMSHASLVAVEHGSAEATLVSGHALAGSTFSDPPANEGEGFLLLGEPVGLYPGAWVSLGDRASLVVRNPGKREAVCLVISAEALSTGPHIAGGNGLSWRAYYEDCQ